MKICSLVTKLACLVTNTQDMYGREAGVPDSELIQGILSPARLNEAITRIYQLYFSSLSWYVMNNSGSRQDAEDIFQEVVITFIRLVQEGKFRGESSIKTFLFSLNRHAWLNELKRRNRAMAREERFESELDRHEADVSYFICDRESRKRLDELMRQLGENCRTILQLYYFDDLSLKDILHQLHYESEQAVRNKKYKCMKQLRELIEANPAAMQILKNIVNG